MISIDVTRGIQKIKAGLKQDVENLFSEFETRQSIRFFDFACLWREKSFNFIFTYKLNENDLREFIEEAYNIILEPFNSKLSSLRAITSLYFIYAIYINQPIEPKIPIKLNLNKYKAFKMLFIDSKAHQHIDVCYIWLKLLSIGAFHLVARNIPYGPLTIKKSTVSSASSSFEFSIGHLSDLEAQMNDLKGLHQVYNSFKARLEGDDVSQVKDLNMVGDSLFTEYEKLAEKVETENTGEDDFSQLSSQSANLCAPITYDHGDPESSGTL